MSDYAGIIGFVIGLISGLITGAGAFAAWLESRGRPRIQDEHESSWRDRS